MSWWFNKWIDKLQRWKINQWPKGDFKNHFLFQSQPFRISDSDQGCLKRVTGAWSKVILGFSLSLSRSLGSLEFRLNFKSCHVKLKVFVTTFESLIDPKKYLIIKFKVISKVKTHMHAWIFSNIFCYQSVSYELKFKICVKICAFIEDIFYFQ